MNIVASLGSPAVIDCILAAMAFEWLVLAAVRRRRRRGPSMGASFVSLGAGAGLLLALRAALTASGPLIVEGWLLASLAAHLIDLKIRWSTTPLRLAERVGRFHSQNRY